MYTIMFYGGLSLGISLLAVAILLFFTLRIPAVIGYFRKNKGQKAAMRNLRVGKGTATMTAETRRQTRSKAMSVAAYGDEDTAMLAVAQEDEETAMLGMATAEDEWDDEDTSLLEIDRPLEDEETDEATQLLGV